jgi:hypothetical protein
MGFPIFVFISGSGRAPVLLLVLILVDQHSCDDIAMVRIARNDV